MKVKIAHHNYIWQGNMDTVPREGERIYVKGHYYVIRTITWHLDKGHVSITVLKDEK